MTTFLRGLLIAIAFSSAAHATEEPAYESAGAIGDVELRDYQPTIQARTTITPDDDSSSSFRRLASYIFGGNDAELSIAMTAPVERRMGDESYMAFTMPSHLAMSDLPSPDDASVTLHPLSSRRLAVISFSGWARDEKVEAMTTQLLATLAEHGIEPLGPPSLNQYNPPWTLPWKRRNEVVVEIPAIGTAGE